MEGWAEGHLYVQSFRSLDLIVHSPPVSTGVQSEDTAALSEALTFLISGILIAFPLDLLYVVPAQGTAQRLLPGLQGITFKQVHTLRADWEIAVAGSPFAEVDIACIEPHLWWENEGAAKAKETLNYLAKRFAVSARKEGKGSRRHWLSFLRRGQ